MNGNVSKASEGMWKRLFMGLGLTLLDSEITLR